MSQLPAHFHPSAGDSAGQPWAGRTFDANRFADDDGTAPRPVVSAMAAFRSGDAGEADVVDALRGARVLIPVVAVLGEAAANERGQTTDKSADLSIVTVAGPDGRTVLPVFTSTAAMRQWNAAARPVPAEFRTAAIAAVDEGTDLIVVDPGADTEFGVRRPAVWAVARDEPWRPAVHDENVARALAEAIADEALVRGIEIAPGAVPGRLSGAEVAVTIVLEGGDTAAVQSLIGRVNLRWSRDPLVATAVDSLVVRARRDDRSASPDAIRPPGAEPTSRLRRLFGRR